MSKINAGFEKKLAAFTSIVSNASLIILKIVVGFISGSVSVVSEAIHSFGDLVASFIAFFSVSKSSKPADDGHPLGHGKYEDLAGFIESLLIIATAIYIFYIAIEKIITKNYYEIQTSPAIAVMGFSVILNFIVSSYLYKVAKKTDSIALYTDAQHLSADIYSSLAILIGLLLTKLTGFYILDPILALIVGFIVLWTGIKLVRQCTNTLLDCSLPEEDKLLIEQTVKNLAGHGLYGIKSIKATKSGSNKIIQMVIYLDPLMSLNDAHKICDSIEHEVEVKLKNSDLIIHPEPFTHNLHE